jgi:hypothetical protein
MVAFLFREGAAVCEKESFCTAGKPAEGRIALHGVIVALEMGGVPPGDLDFELSPFFEADGASGKVKLMNRRVHDSREHLFMACGPVQLVHELMERVGHTKTPFSIISMVSRKRNFNPIA